MALDTAHNVIGGVPHSQGTKKELIFSKTKWDVEDARNIALVFLVHIGVLFGAPCHFNWSAFWVAVILFWITFPIGISLSYHRNLTHKSFKLAKPLEYLFAYFGLHAAQGDPMYWVNIHRHHHQFADSDRDVHSPLEGFWFSHINWIFHNNHLKEKTVRIACGHHLIGMITSVCHKWGKAPWHNNHHAFQFSARLGLEWWQIDIPWYIVKLLEYNGLETDVKVQTMIQKRKMSFKSNDEFEHYN